MFFCKFKKVIAGILIGFGVRNSYGFISSSSCLDIHYWSRNGYRRHKIFIRKVKEEKNDNSSKKGT